MSIIADIEQQLNEDADLLSQDWRSPKDAVRWLEKSGYQKIGKGAFAVAYAKTNAGGISRRQAVRISLKPDYCYHEFLEWWQANSNNKFVPTLYGVQHFGKGDRSFVVTIAEYLHSLTPVNVMQTVDIEGLAELYTSGAMSHEIHRAIERRFAKEGVPKDQISAWLDEHHLNDFSITMNALDQLADSNDCFFDYHHENVMYRPSTRGLVLIDPLADLAGL
jgi:hypothetical protein